jgi:hypothetical protein
LEDAEKPVEVNKVEAKATSSSTSSATAGTGGMETVLGDVSSLLRTTKAEPKVNALISRSSHYEDGVLLDSGAAALLIVSVDLMMVKNADGGGHYGTSSI